RRALRERGELRPARGEHSSVQRARRIALPSLQVRGRFRNPLDVEPPVSSQHDAGLRLGRPDSVPLLRSGRSFLKHGQTWTVQGPETESRLAKPIRALGRTVILGTYAEPGYQAGERRRPVLVRATRQTN